MRISHNKVSPLLKKQIVSTFVQLLTDLTKPQETSLFLQDFLTESEVEAFSKRLAVAYYLKKGRSYSNIKQNLKVSSATIASVQEGIEKPGIKLAIKKLEADEWANVWAAKIGKILPVKN
jgi:uncharacterized protein YerC